MNAQGSLSRMPVSAESPEELAANPKVRAQIEKLMSENAPLTSSETAGVMRLLDAVNEKTLGLSVVDAEEEIARLEQEIDVYTRLRLLRLAKIEAMEAAAIQTAPIASLGLAGIARSVLVNTGYTLQELKGAGRYARLCRVRFAYYRAAYNAGYSYRQIADFVNRDHGTVVYGLRKRKGA